jgi:hypothetical protein
MMDGAQRKYYDSKPELPAYKTMLINTEVLPNVTAEWLALLLRIQNVPDSSLSPETGYPA